jgi:hypothetical protein
LGSNNGAAFVGKSATIVLEELLIQDSSSSASISITISKWGPDLVGAALKSLCPILVTSFVIMDAAAIYHDCELFVQQFCELIAHDLLRTTTMWQC